MREQPSPERHDQEDPVIEEIEVRGHIIDSLLLPKILDSITAAGGSFRIKDIAIGQRRDDPSMALIEVVAASQTVLDAILATVGDHGAVRTQQENASLSIADIEGAFPEGFYSTTNQRTEVRIDGHWIDVEDQEMDCGIAVDTASQTARCVPMSDVATGLTIVVGHAGVRVFPHGREQAQHGFEFMASSVSTEKPKGAIVREIARLLVEAKRAGEGVLVVAGPAVVHTGSGEHFSWLIRNGFIQTLFAGNALATHDIEQSLYGTSLGVQLGDGGLAEAGHEHHLRAINRIRRAGSIRAAVDQGLLTSGIMYECVQHEVDFLLAGSIRDDGPLPDVITDVIDAQRQMREKIRNVSLCLMIATALHSIAVGNLLPAWVKAVCIDINPSTVIKLNDRGSFQTLGLVTDVEPFLRVLVEEVQAAEER